VTDRNLRRQPEDRISLAPALAEGSIVTIRGEGVILDSALARLYGVETKALNQAVRRNRRRFPPDFMFELTREEASRLRLRSQSVTLKRGQHRKYPPLAFTEQGVAMLSSVLRSPRAVAANIEIMRAFVRLRRIATSHADLSRRLEELEEEYDTQFGVVFEAIRELMEPHRIPRPRRPIGFRALRHPEGLQS
jgi:hypothetical protein